jgi:hypothetical protein
MSAVGRNINNSTTRYEQRFSNWLQGGGKLEEQNRLRGIILHSLL